METQLACDDRVAWQYARARGTKKYSGQPARGWPAAADAGRKQRVIARPKCTRAASLLLHSCSHHSTGLTTFLPRLWCLTFETPDVTLDICFVRRRERSISSFVALSMSVNNLDIALAEASAILQQGGDPFDVDRRELERLASASPPKKRFRAQRQLFPCDGESPDIDEFCKRHQRQVRFVKPAAVLPLTPLHAVQDLYGSNCSLPLFGVSISIYFIVVMSKLILARCVFVL